MKEEFKNVTLAHTSFGVVSNLINIFGFVFFFKYLGNSLPHALGLFSLIHLFYGVSTVFFGKLIGNLGSRTSALTGFTFFVVSVMFLSFFTQTEENIFLVFFIVSQVIGKFFYHIPSHIFRLKVIKPEELGNKMSFLKILWDIISLIVPIAGGFASEYLGSFGLVMLALLALVPAYIFFGRLPNYKFSYTLKLKDVKHERTLRNLINLSWLISFQTPLVLIWPVWLYLSLSSSFSNLGLFSSAVIAASFVVAKLFGNFLDNHDRKKALYNLCFFEGIEWILKFFSFNQIFLVISDLYGKISRALFSIAYDTYTYSWFEHHEEEALFDERIILREFATNVFIGIFFAVNACISFFFPMNTNFLVFGILYVLVFGWMEVLKKKI